MAENSKFHRTTGTDIIFTFWLSFDPSGDVKLTKQEPSLSPRQRAMHVEARLPKSLWNIPTLSAEIAVPDPGQPDAITARIEQFAEQLKTAVGCDVVLNVKPMVDRTDG